METRRSTIGAVVPVVLVLLFAIACSSSNGAVGTYTHAEEGTIELTSDNKGTWTQSGNDSAFEFTWSEDGDAISFTAEGETEGGVKIVDGNLVLPPNMISGDDPVTFTRQ